MSVKLTDRGQALETEFFHQQDQKAIEALKNKLENKAASEALSEHIGVGNLDVVGSLVSNGINVETFAAIKFTPLVLVAWADNQLDEQERASILEKAQEKGVSEDIMKVVGSWMSSKPNSSLKKAWIAFMTEYVQSLEGPQRNALKAEILGDSTDVAASSGGFFGFGSISEPEQELIDELSAVFLI